MKKITYANKDGLFRLRAVEKVQQGESMYSVAKKVGVHQTTISEWVKMYKEGGIDRLNTYRKPRPKHDLDESHIIEDLEKSSDKQKEILMSLLDLARSKNLRKTAEKFGISEQGLAKRRRLYLNRSSVE